MVNDELLAYIKTQRNKNTPVDLITARLLQAGWLKADIDEALAKSEPAATPVVTSKPLDPYRELPTETLQNGEVVKITPPIMVTPKVEPVVFNPTQKPATVTPVVPTQQPAVEVSIEKKTTPVVETPNVEPLREAKVWTPMQAKPIEPAVETQPLEITPPEVEGMEFDPSKMAPVGFTVRDTSPKEVTPVAQTTTTLPVMGTIVSQVATAPLSPAMPEGMSQNPVEKTVSTIPDMPVEPSTPVVEKPIVEQKPITTPFVQPVKENPVIEIKPSVQATMPIASMPIQTTADMLSKNAMMATYSKDMDASKDVPVNVLAHHTSNFKKLGVIILILCALFGVTYGFMAGYISVPSFLKFTLVKKDPKDLLVHNGELLASHASYKADTTIVLSTPAVANITSGLMNGAQVVSKDTDSVTLALSTKVGTVSGSRVYDTALHLSSSLLKNDIISNVVSNGNTTYLSVPSLTEVLGDAAPAPALVALPEGHFGALSNELPTSITDVIKRIDVYDIASKGIPPFVKQELESSFADFVGSAQVTDKGTEVIHDTTTYHYVIAPDRQVTKKFLNDALNVFITTLSPEMKQNVDEALGSVRFDDFDVWIGKSDGMIHQYKVTLIAPLSKVIALDDKGIAGNVVRFSIMTTYYDFDVANEVSVPENSVTADEYAKTMHDAKIQSVIKSFTENATILSHADGGYGKTPNPIGSCVSPRPGSLFSPIGHSKGASNAVGALSDNMNTLLSLSGQAGSCYSTPSAWALAVPKSTDPSTSYCVDSTGTTATLLSPLSGTICK